LPHALCQLAVEIAEEWECLRCIPFCSQSF
jgi:hypothetical protein